MKSNSAITIGIVSKPQPSGKLPLLDDLMIWLRKRKINFILDPVSSELIGSVAETIIERPELPGMCEFIVVLGGDGTLLSIARHCIGFDVPILGVNLGSLGFLTEISSEQLFPALEQVLSGSALIQSRMTLAVKLTRNGEEIAFYRCLNDVVLNKAALARIIGMHVRLGDGLLGDIRADGLIVSTPTGSTAYNLSAGGPIVTPGMNAIILNPICPHTLSLRPLIVDVTAPIEISLSGESGEVYLTADGQLGHPVGKDDVIRIDTSPETVKLVSTRKRNYFSLLRDKLGWGT